MDWPKLFRERSSQLHPVYLGLSFEAKDIYVVLELANSFTIPQESATFESTLLCLVEVPELMLPTDILHFFSAAEENIRCLRVFKQYLDPAKFTALIFLDSPSSTQLFFQHFQQQSFSALFEGSCSLSVVVSISLQTDSLSLPLQNHEKLSGSLTSWKDLETFVSAECSKGDVEHIPHLLSSASASEVTNTDLDAENTSSSLSEILVHEQCALCLEPLSVLCSSVVLYCGHRFHCLCLRRMEGRGCPVCRFRHAVPWQSTPCCSLCVADTSEPHMQSLRPTPQKNVDLASSARSESGDLWVCLVCGDIFCGGLGIWNHRQLHFSQTQHAYFLHTLERKVFDCAGDGFVHRLALSHAGSAPNSSKVVEVASSPSVALTTGHSMRSHMPPLHSTVEEVAAQDFALEQVYTTLAARRAVFDAQLRRLWTSGRVEQSDSAEIVEPDGLCASVGSVHWLRHVSGSLAQELTQKRQSLRSLQERREAARRKLAEHETLAAQLQCNEELRKSQLREAEQRLRERESAGGRLLHALEERVAALMQRLEEGPRFDSSVRSYVGDNAAAQSSGDDELMQFDDSER